MYLYGKNSVYERLKANPKSIKKIFLQDDFSFAEAEKLIKENNIPAKRVSQKELRRIKRADSLQGVVAQVEEFKYTDFDELLNNAEEKNFSFIFLDRIFDPQNLGAIIRTTACLGGFGVVLPKHKACQVTETVLRVSCGGENYTPVSLVSNLTNALLKAKKCGFWAVGSAVEEGKDIGEIELPFPLCFILGSEGSGVRYGLGKHIDIKVNIPMKGAALSFNVAAAAAIFCYAISQARAKGNK